MVRTFLKYLKSLQSEKTGVQFLYGDNFLINKRIKINFLCRISGKTFKNKIIIFDI